MDLLNIEYILSVEGNFQYATEKRKMVEAAADWYTALTQKDPEAKKIIFDYMSEIDADDWAEGIKLDLSYELINFILKQRHSKRKDLSYHPELLQTVDTSDMINQVTNARKLQRYLYCAPPVTKDIFTHPYFYLYRGFRYDDYYFGLAKNLLNSNNKILTIPFFLSTSINRDVAKRFTATDKKCLWVIAMPHGTPLSFIREIRPNDDINECNECEVLLNVGAVLELQQCITSGTNGVRYNELIENDADICFIFKMVGYSAYAGLRNFWSQVQRTAIDYGTEFCSRMNTS
jgi:hypothetical protein